MSSEQQAGSSKCSSWGLKPAAPATVGRRPSSLSSLLVPAAGGSPLLTRAQVNGAASLLFSSQRRDGPEGSPEQSRGSPLVTRGQPRASGVWASQAPLQRRLAAWLLRAVGVLPPCDAAAAPSAGRCRRGRTRPPSASRARLCGTQAGSTLGQRSASWLSGGWFQRQVMPQAARRFGQPRPISRLSRAGRPHRACFRHGSLPGPEAASSTRRGSVAPGGGLGRRRCSACACSVCAAKRQWGRQCLCSS